MLLYHAVMEEPPDWIAEFTVSPDMFAAQLDAIADSGRTPVGISALVEHLAGAGVAGAPCRPHLRRRVRRSAGADGRGARRAFDAGHRVPDHRALGAGGSRCRPPR
ncbi:hypothetical protein NKH18_20395 [Streptomyces sp. M10(2022)]